MGRLLKLLLAAGGVAAAVRAARSPRGRHALNKARGAAATAMPKPPGDRPADLDDVSLARKVETEIFRAADAPKGDVSVDVQAAIVHLRGEVSDEAWIERLGDEAGKVDGIRGVKNLLHKPGTPAPDAEPRGAVTERAG